MSAPSSPVFRFAPSPNGALHLGHALSALLNQDMAKASGGRLLLRLENTDLARCPPEKEQAMLNDLLWLGIAWEQPVRRQSDHVADYQAALDRLIEQDLVYPAFLSRGEIKAHAAQTEAHGASWPRDPDGSPHYPPVDRQRSAAERQQLITSGARHAWRLDIGKALRAAGPLPDFVETGDTHPGRNRPDPARWGDVILWRSDAPSSYHLSVTVDDALQGITHVVRGMDMFAATSVHILLQRLLGLPQPAYHHHRLILDETGRKLSKSQGDESLQSLRQRGLSALDIRRLVGL